MSVINFHEPYITGNELGYLKDVIERKNIYGNGIYTQKCQELIQETISVRKVFLTDSCTSALEISALLVKYDLWKWLFLNVLKFWADEFNTVINMSRKQLKIIFVCI